ncbi:MAG: hypothetical protein QOI13_2057 [Paraburkholderia sp.]|jgi:hypothetical protein|nr:hypothetical protein [Paraburkholderia sp.]
MTKAPPRHRDARQPRLRKLGVSVRTRFSRERFVAKLELRVIDSAGHDVERQVVRRYFDGLAEVA